MGETVKDPAPSATCSKGGNRHYPSISL
uniref:Uncharacterized protein n=1 Tax=Nelumbo nucifera TaxID=4432 RepID=A0A822YM44_NELNU|nr:TPA_asm: hypothetical protein HUJ06_012521 [Nelumbo nucifera]